MDAGEWIIRAALSGGSFVAGWWRTWKISRRLDRVETILRERAPERAQDVADRVIEETVVHEGHAEQELIEEIRASLTPEAIGNAIGELPDDEKLVTTLLYYEDLTIDEVAEVLGVSTAQADQIHIRA